MNRKLRVIILTMVLTVLMFGGTRLMAQDNLDVNTTEASQTVTPKDEGNLGPKANGDEETPLVDTTEENTESDAIDAKDSEKTDMGGVTNPDNEGETPDANQKDKAGDENADKAKDAAKGDANGEKADTPKGSGEAKAEEGKDADAQKSLEENKESAKGNGAEDGAAPAKAPEKPAGEGKTGEEPKEDVDDGKPTKPVNKKDQIDKSADEKLKAQEEKINAEKDPEAKKKLQAEYNKMYFDALKESGKEKLDDAILDRFTDKYRTKEYYALKDEYQKLQAKAKEGKLTQEELDAFNNKLGTFDPPRILDNDEKGAQDKLAESVDVPGLQDGKSTDPKAQEKLDAYNNAKKALKDALNPENDRTTTAEELKKLLEDFEKAEKALKDGIKAGTITPKYTDGDPTVKVFPLDSSGKVGKELNKEDDTYYIPDNTDINLLVHVSKDEEPKEFTFTIKALKKGAEIKGEEAKNLAFLNGNPVELKKNEDGSYSFTVSSANMNFGIAQLRFNVPGFKAAFHNGFDLEMDLGNNNKVTKQFRITKKGYEDDAKIDGKGSDTDENPKDIPEIDAGKTENAIVDKDTDKVFDFFTYLKKSNTYIDKVTFNSGNGESLPLNSVDITITVPKSGESNFAKMIHKSGLEYYSLGDGKYQLKLKTKVFNGNLTKTKDGKLMYNDQELTAKNLKDVVLENAGKKVYVDKEGKAHNIITSEVLEKDGYKVEGGKLYKKNDQDQSKFDEIGTFDKDGKIKTNDKIYVLDGNTLITYTKEYDVYDGYVANKDGEADPDVTPTYKGNQVTIKTKVEKDGTTTTETSYGGTIVKNAIYDKNGKIFNEEGYNGQPGDQVIDSSGKKANDVTIPTEGLKAVKDDNGKILYQYFVENGETYRIVKNAVFKGDYIIDGLEYNKGLSLIDKFGKKMNIEVTGNSTDGYTFIRKVKDKEGKETEEKKTSGKDGENRTIKVSTDKDGQILVNSKNEVVDNKGNKYTIVGNKYYYDGEKFVEATGNGLKGNKFRDGYNSTDLDKTIKNTYNDGKNDVDIKDFDNKTKYEGSLNPKDYYIVGDKVYVKKGDIYISANPDETDEVLTEKTIAKIVQVLGTDKDAIEKVTDETDIFNAIKNAKFALRFPSFLAGKNVVYNVHADVKATYLAPNPDFKPNVPVSEDNKEFVEKSIFTTEKAANEADKTKKIDKFFTLKNEKSSSYDFFKNAPEELSKTPDYHFFNIFYRGLGYRDRDALIIDLLNTKKTEGGKTKQDDENLTEDQKKAQEVVKAKLALLDKLQGELGRLYNGAKFVLSEDGKSFEIQRDGKKVEIERSLLWEIGFNNSKGNLFPENKDTEIVIEDHSMDNRLVYDEIIVNDTEAKWNEAKTNWENDTKNQGKKFEGTDEYFFLDQIKNIKFGVNPNFVEGRFVPLGADFNLTGEEIIAALNATTAGAISYGDESKTVDVVIENGKKYIQKGEIKFELTRDTAKGQVRIKVLDAFYKHNDSYDASKDDNNYKFSSPVQEAYQKKIDDALGMLGDNGSITTASDVNSLKTAFDGLLKVIHAESTDCYNTIKAKFEEIMTEISSMTGTDAEQKKAAALKQVKDTLKNEIPELKLKYLDTSKKTYNNDDMRFNAIHITINSGVSIGGALVPQKTKKLGITSVIVPEIDIPYTDEFGNPLTNKDMYVKAEIEKIKKDEANNGKYNNYLSSEELFGEIMSKAYENVNKMTADSFKELVTIKDESKYAWEKYGAVKGSTLDYKYLAPNVKDIIKDKDGNSINPWYIGNETVDQRFEKMFGNDSYKDKAEYKKLVEKAIDIAAYYMSSQGYDRATYANKAVYKLAGSEEKPGIFGSESDWHKKVCYSGILGKCIEDAGKGIVPDTEPSGKNFGTDGKDDGKFELTYEPSHDEPDKENPKTDKSTEDKEVDISEENKEKSVDFTIEVTVDKMTKDQKKIADALTPDDKKSEDAGIYKGYKENGYYEYKISLIIDFLPEIFKLKDGTTLTFTADKDKLMANGANAGFNNDDVFNAWQKGIEYFYTDDLEAEYEKLSKSSNKVDKEKAEVLKKAIDDAKASGKIKDGQKVQAVLAWVPTFEAPHGSKNQFRFELTNLSVDKKKFKDFNDGVIGTNYTNHAAFGDKAKFYFGSTTVNIHKDKHGYVNKYLQVLDKDNNVIDKDKADGWFKGNVELKFGDKFNYRIEYKNNNNIVPVPGEAHSKAEINIKDLFKDGYKGFRPVLNGFVESDFEFKNQVTITYKTDKKTYTEDDFRKAIEAGEVKFSDVTSLELEGLYENGATHNFILPMMIPNIDAKIEGGKVVYIGQDGEKHELGKAEDFFDLEKLTDKDSEMAFDNKVDKSNTVTVYLEKERFIRVFKEFLAANGEKLKNLDNLEARFDVYQIIEENGKKTRVKLDKQLIANKANDFTDMIDHLPIFKKTTTVKENGTVKVEKINYEYELVEKAMPGFKSKVYKLDDSDKLGFVWQATNTEKHEEPEEPGDNPKKEPKKVTVTIRVNKTWEVLNNGSTPSIQVELYANGKATGKVFTLGDGNWSAVFENLPSKDDDGNEIIYTVVEVGSDNGITMIEDRKFEVIYNTNEDGSITILNKEVPKEEEKDKEEPKKDNHEEDNEEEKDLDQGKNKLPKTGVAEDLASIYFAFLLLLGLVFIKKRYLVK